MLLSPSLCSLMRDILSRSVDGIGVDVTSSVADVMVNCRL